MPIIVVANKSNEPDIERVVEPETVDQFIKLWNCAYLECNAKVNSKIIDVFAEVLRQAVGVDLHKEVRQKNNLNSAYKRV